MSCPRLHSPRHVFVKSGFNGEFPLDTWKGFYLYIYSLLFIFIHLFKNIYFWLCWVFITMHRLSLAAESRKCTIGVVCGILLPWLLWEVSVALGFSSCPSQSPECRLSSCGTQAFSLQRVGSSQTRDQTSVPCIVRQITAGLPAEPY